MVRTDSKRLFALMKDKAWSTWRAIRMPTKEVVPVKLLNDCSLTFGLTLVELRADLLTKNEHAFSVFDISSEMFG
jgi:hypothetical protein